MRGENKQMRADVKQDFDSLRNELGTKISGIQTSLEALQERIGGIESKIKENNTKVDESLKLAHQKKAAINMISQSQLQNKIEISGSNFDTNLKGEQLILKVKLLIESFGIPLSDHDIKQAFQRPKKHPAAPVVVVEFHNYDTKFKVLQEKRNIASNNKVYFDNCLTPLNRYLMYKAREVAKDKNFRV